MRNDLSTESREGKREAAGTEANHMNQQKLAVEKALAEARRNEALGHYGLAAFWYESVRMAMVSIQN